MSWLPLYICLAFLLLVLKTPSYAFGRPKQPSASEVRERTGHDSRVKVRDSGEIPLLPLSDQEKQLLRRISSASEQRNWWEVQSCISKYPGNAIQIYGAAMNAALRCRKYKEGALIFEKCRETCEEFDPPIYTFALRIFGKLGKPEKVRIIWDEALEKCKRDSVLVASRLHAAADEGDVETAAAMLDLLNTSKLEVSSIALTSAIRSCWGWGAKQHKAAKYFWDLFPAFASERSIVSFTALIGSYMTAPLEDILSAKAEMETLEIQPNNIFAETYVATLLQQRFTDLRSVDAIEDALRDKPESRLEAAKEALGEF